MENQWTQEQFAQTLETWLGTRWTSSSFSVAEQSVNDGARKREFDANEILSLARAFGKPVGAFFVPPPDVDGVKCGAEGLMISRDELERATAPIPPDEDPISAIEQAVVRLRRRELGREALRPLEGEEDDNGSVDSPTAGEETA